MKLRNVKVQNMESPRTNNPVPNQFRIHTKEGVYFQSYNTVIAFIRSKDGKVFLDDNAWDYSGTTSKYRNIFLGEGKTRTVAKINSGEYKLVDLN
jgi:hypothetical protein